LCPHFSSPPCVPYALPSSSDLVAKHEDLTLLDPMPTIPHDPEPVLLTSHRFLGLPSGRIPRDFPQTVFTACLPIRATCSAFRKFLDFITQTTTGALIVRSSYCKILKSSFDSYLTDLNNFLDSLFSSICNSSSILDVLKPNFFCWNVILPKAFRRNEHSHWTSTMMSPPATLHRMETAARYTKVRRIPSHNAPKHASLCYRLRK
jgi:hypothetical protein